MTVEPPLEREHATHEGLPGNRTNDAVYGYGRNVERKGLLKTTHCRLRLWSKDPVDLGTFAGIAGQIAELKLLLHSSNRVALASALDLHNESHPGHRIDDPVNRRPRVGLKRFHCGFGIRT